MGSVFEGHIQITYGSLACPIRFLIVFDFNQLGPRLPAPAGACSRTSQTGAAPFAHALEQADLPLPKRRFAYWATDQETLSQRVSRLVQARAIPVAEL